jgi:protein-arginine kinase activator protein McsA
MGPGEMVADSRQLEFDFKNDPDPESLFPTCASCSSPFGLHLVEFKENGHTASILCMDCRLDKSKVIDTSIPLQLVNRSVLNHILEIKKIKKIDSSVTAFRELLDIRFQVKWDELAKTKSKKKSMKQGKKFGGRR